MQAIGPILGELVLLGGGHAQVSVLKKFAMNPVPGLRLTLVTQDVRTPYSGMLPGFVEGVWTADDIHIDLSRLAQMAGARLIVDSVTGLDADKKRLDFADRPSMTFDMLSINIGGQPDLGAIAGARTHAIPVKPISTFQHRLDHIFTLAHPRRIAVIGGGAAGCELALALSKRWLDQFGERPKMALYSRSQRVMSQMNAAAAKIIARDLQKIGCTLFLGQEVTEIGADYVCLANGLREEFDACFLVSAVTPPDWLSRTGLALDQRGFIAVEPSLQSSSHPAIFASGDIASLSPDERPKAGVFAVRAGPILGHNLRQYALGAKLRPWRPQRRYLALVGTADGKAVAVRGRHASKSRFWWLLKCWIDRRWMAKYTHLEMAPPTPPLRLAGINGRVGQNLGDVLDGDPAFEAMRCLGCGAKTGHETLAAALGDAARLAISAGASAKLMPAQGLGEDSAILPAGPVGADIVQSVDMLSEIINDPYLLGKIAAVHALSDLFAANAVPAYALAILNLGAARIDLQQQQLTQLLAGGLSALAAEGVRLVGGHTSEGPELSVGFAVTGWRNQAPAPLSLDQEYLVVLSKPLGTGVIMAGQMKLLSDGYAVDAAIASMERSNAAAAKIFNDAASGAAWMTDVTGFGLARHAQNLVERVGFTGVEITLSDVPVISGAVALLASGVRSSLHDQNRAAVRYDETGLSARQRVRAEIVFDPQTSGGLLAVLTPQTAHAALRSLTAQNHDAAIIGRTGPGLTGLRLSSGGGDG